ncbi:MAG: hypothetical protein ETSY2_44890 [Candidatus Entotheonella gemina]|uniref:Uncharacterized protein n=1 Tax=Candidatus Entotheonella gemina TaxID=1429439 RepID=W4LHW3_9BACT|nr:MAG: hypothetical protein ETSY2_44890 [Candidatus Entotheonella gemina]
MTAQRTEKKKATAKRGVVTPNAIAFETETRFLTIYTATPEQRTEVVVFNGAVEVKHARAFEDKVMVNLEGAQTVRQNFRALLKGPAERTGSPVQLSAVAVVPDEPQQFGQKPKLQTGIDPHTETITPDSSSPAPKVILDLIFSQ